MLYEYGIRSTYLQGIEDQSMATHEYTSSSGFLSFRLPSLQKKQRVQGLNLTILYGSSGGENKVIWPPLIKIGNRTKGLTWVYVPVVYGKPSFDNDVVWLSYWPLGDILDTGDDVHVEVFLDRGTMMVRECGVSLVYRDDGEVEKDERCDERMKREEGIGGDLSLFQVTKGAYYLCRIDFFKSQTPYFLKQFFGDNIEYTIDSRRWRTYCHGLALNQELNVYQNPNRIKHEFELGVSFNNESETDKIEKAVSSLEGVESVSIHKEIGRLIVVGRVDVQAVATCVREFEKLVQVLRYRRV